MYRDSNLNLSMSPPRDSRALQTLLSREKSHNKYCNKEHTMNFRHHYELRDLLSRQPDIVSIDRVVEITSPRIEAAQHPNRQALAMGSNPLFLSDSW